MRGSDNTKDTETGAVLRRNITAILETRGEVPKRLYTSMGWTAARFWGQFSQRVRGPGLDFVERVAEQLQVHPWRLLVREGESGLPVLDDRPPPPYYMNPSQEPPPPNPLQARDFFRTWPALIPAFPTDPSEGEPWINFLVRQNAAIGCHVAQVSDLELRGRLRVSRATWWSWFRRKTGVALADIWRIAKVLDMQPWEFLAPVAVKP